MELVRKPARIYWVEAQTLTGPHYAEEEEEEVMADLEEDEEDGPEYKTDAPSQDSYITPPSTGGCSEPSHPTQSPTPEVSNPEDSAALHTAELKAHIELFLEEAEEDMELDPPPLENVTPLPTPAPIIPGFVPFTVKTSQCCIPPKSLLWKVYHPYQDPVGQCHCESGGWCNNLPCSSRTRHIPYKIRGHSLSNGGLRLGRSYYSTLEEPFNQSGSSCS